MRGFLALVTVLAVLTALGIGLAQERAMTVGVGPNGERSYGDPPASLIPELKQLRPGVWIHEKTGTLYGRENDPNWKPDPNKFKEVDPLADGRWSTSAHLPERWILFPGSWNTKTGHVPTWAEFVKQQVQERKMIRSKFKDAASNDQRNYANMLAELERMPKGRERDRFYRTCLLHWMIMTDNVNFDDQRLYPPGTTAERRQEYQTFRPQAPEEIPTPEPLPLPKPKPAKQEGRHQPRSWEPQPVRLLCQWPNRSPSLTS